MIERFNPLVAGLFAWQNLDQVKFAKLNAIIHKKSEKNESIHKLQYTECIRDRAIFFFLANCDA